MYIRIYLHTSDVPMSLTSVHVNALEFNAFVTAVINALNSTLDHFVIGVGRKAQAS